MNNDNQTPDTKVYRLKNEKPYVSKAMKKAELSIDMFHPRYWLQWISFLFIQLIVLLPYSVLMFLGDIIGKVALNVAKKRRRITRINLKLCYPEKSDQEIKELVKQCFQNLGRGIFETAIAWYWSDRRLAKIVHIDDNELKIAKEQAEKGQGIIVLTCHFYTLELMARIYGSYIKPGVGVYRPNDNKVLEYLQVKGRTRSNLYLVDRKNTLPIVKALRQGLPIWYAPDQDYGHLLPHVYVPFFKVPNAATVTGTASLAKIKNTVIQPSFAIRLPKNKGYQLRILPLVENFPSGDDYNDAAYINKVVENMINHATGQYMWLHKRFKTTEDGTDRYKVGSVH